MRCFSVCALVLTLIIPFLASAQDADRKGMEAMRLLDQGKTAEAIKILEGLAENGESKAMVQSVICYYEGTGVDKDFDKAMDWFLKSFEKENAEGFSIFEYSTDIFDERHRYISLDDEHNMSLAYKIGLTSSPVKAYWSEWRKPDFLPKDSSGKFNLLQGREPKEKYDGNAPAISPHRPPRLSSQRSSLGVFKWAHSTEFFHKQITEAR